MGQSKSTFLFSKVIFKDPPKIPPRTKLGIVQKVFSEKPSAIARMRQKCVRNASKWVLFIEKRGKFQNSSEMRQKCAEHLGGEHLLDDTEKPIHAGKKSWGIIFCANTSGACVRTRANTGKYFRGAMFLIFPILGTEFMSVQIHAAPVSAPARIQEKIILVNNLCIGFVLGGTI